MPVQAVNEILRITGDSIADIDFVAMNGHYAAYPMTREELLKDYETVNDFGVTLRRAARRAVTQALRPTPLDGFYRERRQRRRVRGLTELGIPWDKIVFVDHHTAHAAAAYYGWGNFEDDVLVLTCDGAGDRLCATTLSLLDPSASDRLEQLVADDDEPTIPGERSPFADLTADPGPVGKINEAARRFRNVIAQLREGSERCQESACRGRIRVSHGPDRGGGVRRPLPFR